MSDLKSQQQDDFQFKPLTQGLGFHPKKEPNRQASTPVTPKMTSPKWTSSQPSVPSLRLDTPLPRPEPQKTPTPSSSGQAVEKILKNLNEKNKRLSFQDKPQNLSPYLQTAPSLAAGFLDLLLVTALSLLYLMTLILTLKLDLIKSISEGSQMVWLSTGAVFIVVGFIYYVGQRMFIGFTLGEWAYEQRLGLPEEMKKASYSLKVFYRQILMMVTGVILIPLISWIIGRDLGGISGLCTYRKR